MEGATGEGGKRMSDADGGVVSAVGGRICEPAVERQGLRLGTTGGWWDVDCNYEGRKGGKVLYMATSQRAAGPPGGGARAHVVLCEHQYTETQGRIGWYTICTWRRSPSARLGKRQHYREVLRGTPAPADVPPLSRDDPCVARACVRL